MLILLYSHFMQTNWNAVCNSASSIQPFPLPPKTKPETSQNAILCNCFFPFVSKRLFANQSQIKPNRAMLCFADGPRKESIYNAGEKKP
jgi:hypothetical protein